MQKSVSVDQYGVATTGVTLFHSIGVALFGAVFAPVLQSGLMNRLRNGCDLPRTLNPTAIHHLPEILRLDYLDALGSAIHAVFLLAVNIMVGFRGFYAKQRCEA